MRVEVVTECEGIISRSDKRWILAVYTICRMSMPKLFLTWKVREIITVFKKVDVER